MGLKKYSTLLVNISAQISIFIVSIDKNEQNKTKNIINQTN